MPRGTFDLACSFAAPSTFDGWLRAVPCRREAGGVSWRRVATLTEAYLAAASFVALATLIRLAAHQFVIGSQFAPYFLAVIAATLCGGVCVGLASIAFSMLPAWYFFLAPVYPGFDWGEAYSLVAFVLVAAPMVFIIGNLQGAGEVIQESRLRAAVAEERARTADELRRWKHIFDNISVGIAITDPVSNTLGHVNPAYAAFHGMEGDAVKGVSIFDTYAPGERERIARLAVTVDSEGVIDFEAYHRRTDGSTFPARVHVTSVPRTEAMQAYRIVTVTDITAERELQTRLDDIFDNAAIGISVVDPAGDTVRLANPAYAAAHATSVADVHGKSIFDMHQPHERQRIADLMAASDRDGMIDYEADRVRSGGSTFPARTHVTSVRTPAGTVRYRIVTVQDITRERQLRAELDQAQRLEAIGQLCAGVAHDFNNLLQGIMSHLELVEDDGIPLTTREKVATAIRLVEQAGTLANQLLSFGRKQLLMPQEIELHRFLEDFSGMLSRTLDPRIRIELRLASNLQLFWADPTHLRSALLNLAINARDAMPEGGDLILEAGHADSSNEKILFRVTDTGTGIAPEHLKRVCEPFFSTKGLNGTGLGLSMVHGFAKQSGGDLHISSQPGIGTCVELSLPVHSDPETATA